MKRTASKATSPLRKVGKIQGKRPVGRPRADGRPPITRQQILLSAAAEFSENGFSGSSVRAIAERLDIHTPTIFQHFKSKDALLIALYSEVMNSVLALYEGLEAEGGNGAEQLYRMIYVDVLTVARGSMEVKAILGLPELRRPKFAELLTLREKGILAYEKILQRGMRDGSLRKMPARMTAENLFMLAETSVYAPFPEKLGPARKQATGTADFALAGLLKDRDSLPTIRRTGSRSKYANAAPTAFQAD